MTGQTGKAHSGSVNAPVTAAPATEPLLRAIRALQSCGVAGEMLGGAVKRIPLGVQMRVSAFFHLRELCLASSA